MSKSQSRIRKLNEKAAAARNRANEIVGEALKQRELRDKNPKEYLRQADEKLMKFERDVELMRTG